MFYIQIQDLIQIKNWFYLVLNFLNFSGTSSTHVLFKSGLLNLPILGFPATFLILISSLIPLCYACLFCMISILSYLRYPLCHRIWSLWMFQVNLKKWVIHCCLFVLFVFVLIFFFKMVICCCWSEVSQLMVLFNYILLIYACFTVSYW